MKLNEKDVKIEIKNNCVLFIQIINKRGPNAIC